MSQEEIKKALNDKNITIGSDSVLKMAKIGRLKKVLVAKNCKIEVLKDLEYYARLNKFELIRLNENNEELGVICKKPFFISVLGY